MLECPLNLTGDTQPSLICARIYRHNRASLLIASEISVCSGDKGLSRGTREPRVAPLFRITILFYVLRFHPARSFDARKRVWRRYMFNYPL